MRDTGNLRGMSLRWLIAITCRAGFLFMILVIEASAQTPQQLPRTQTPTQVESASSAPQSIKVCLDRPADAVMTVQKNAQGHLFAHVESDGTAYNNDADGCGYFVADIILPRGFRFDRPPIYPTRIKISWTFGSSLVLTERNCAKASLHAIIYMKTRAPGANFNKSHQQTSQGVWQPVIPDVPTPFCYFAPVNFFKIDVPEGGVLITSVYRVLVSPKLNGQVKQARVNWHWDY